MVAHHFDLDHLRNLSPESAYYSEENSGLNIRHRAIKQAAQALGMQGGLYAESKFINKQLNVSASKLDQIYNFRRLIYHNNVLPPVIAHLSHSLNVSSDGDTIRLGGETYRIIKQVRFVTAPPTWRSYLWMNYQKPTLPNKVLIPTTNREHQIWQQAVDLGWRQGKQQAVQIFKSNLHRLVRDFNGMVLYKKLLLEHMISPFAVNTKNKGITGNGKQMTIDNQLWHINSKPQLQIQSKLWQPTLIPNKKKAP